MTSALAQSYHDNNSVHGHDRGCGFGAGADCYCSVYTRALDEQKRLGRITWRLMQEDSGLDRNTFRITVDALFAFLGEDFGGYDEDDRISQMVRMATIVGSAYWLTNCRFSKVDTPMTALTHAVEDMQEEITKEGGRANTYWMATILEERVRAMQERIEDWRTD